MAKKLVNTIHYAIWVDHKKAIIIHIDSKGVMKEEDLISAFDSRQRFRGETTNKTGILTASLNVKEKEQNRQHAQMHQFCKNIIARVSPTAAFVLLAGPAEAKYDLHREFSRKRSFAQVPIEVKTTGKMKAEGLAVLLKARLAEKARIHFTE